MHNSPHLLQLRLDVLAGADDDEAEVAVSHADNILRVRQCCMELAVMPAAGHD